MKTLTPTTPLARRIAAIVHRGPLTPWSDKEFAVYKKLYKRGAFNEIDIGKVERFQAFSRNERKRGRAAFHRRGLLQLLNHWGEEVDHGTEHDELHPVKPVPRKIIPLPLKGDSEPVVLTPEDEERREKFLEEMRRRNPKSKAFRERPRSAFDHVKKVMSGEIP